MLAGGEATIRPHRWVDIAIVFQGAMNALNPVRTVGSQIVEALELHGRARGAAARAPHRRAARVGRDPGGARRPVPARAVRRDAPARGDRDGALVQPEGADRRRADDRARRDGAGADPRAARRALPRVRARAAPRHARPAGRRAALRPQRRHVRGPRRRAGPVDALYHDPRHPYTRLLFAATPDLDDLDGPDRVDPRRAAAPRPSARRLPVPAALRPRVRPVRRRAGRSRRSATAATAACHLTEVARERERAARGRGSRRPLPGPARDRRHGHARDAGEPCTPSTASRSRSQRARWSRSSASRAAARRRPRRP